VDITFAEAISPKHTWTQQQMAATPVMPAATMMPSALAPFDYQAELQNISQEVETTLQAKFDMAIAKVQQSIANIET